MCPSILTPQALPPNAARHHSHLLQHPEAADARQRRVEQRGGHLTAFFCQQDAAHGSMPPLQNEVPIWNWKRCVRSAAMPLASSSFWYTSGTA